MMRPYLDALELRLATAHAVADRASSRRTAGRRGAGLLAVVGAAATAVLLLRAGGPAALPVFHAPVADASGVADAPGAPPTSRFDFRRAAALPTAGGPGFVLTSRDGRELCLVLPDQELPGTYGSGCTKVARAERRGYLGEMARPGTARRPGSSQFAFVLPAGAASVAYLVRGGRRDRVPVHHGVALAQIQSAAMLEYRVGGQPRSEPLPAPLSDPERATIACGSRTVAISLDSAPRRPDAPAALDTAKLCRDAARGDGRTRDRRP